MNPDRLGDRPGRDIYLERNGRGPCRFNDGVVIDAAARRTQGVEVLVVGPRGKSGGDRRVFPA